MTDLLSPLIDEINTKMKDEQPTTYSSSDNDLPLSVNNKLSDNPGAAQLTASFSQTDFDDLGILIWKSSIIIFMFSFLQVWVMKNY
jgi:hypothetical protein